MKTKLNKLNDHMQDNKHRQRIQPLLDLRGKVQIEYDWEQEEELELKASKERAYHHCK